MPRLGSRAGGTASLLLPGALGTLGAHSVAYRSFFPAGSLHGYFGWYEPLVGVLSLASAIVFVVLVAAAACGRKSTLARRLCRRLAACVRGHGAVGLGLRIAGTSFVLLVAQESLERSVGLGGPSLAVLSARTWLLALIAIGAFSAALTLVAHSGAGLVELVLGRGSLPRARRRLVRGRARAAVGGPRRPRPLAERRGLRAPPLLAG